MKILKRLHLFTPLPQVVKSQGVLISIQEHVLNNDFALLTALQQWTTSPKNVLQIINRC